MGFETMAMPDFNQREKALEQARQVKIHKLAKMMHEEWRQGRRKEDGSFEPRPKKTKDAEWTGKHAGQDEIDIANTEFEELPRDWQEENLLSAKVAIEKIEEALYIVHDKWLDRNDGFAQSDQKVQYSRLPKGEQLKDIVILEKALEIMKG